VIKPKIKSIIKVPTVVTSISPPKKIEVKVAAKSKQNETSKSRDKLRKNTHKVNMSSPNPFSEDKMQEFKQPELEIVGQTLEDEDSKSK